MSRPLSSPVTVDHQVTASELVRHFGIWQERAARAPVYILHRGRPRLVLTSIEVMDALCAPHAPASDGVAALAALLDAEDGIAIVGAHDGGVVRASRGARARFGDLVAAGRPIAAFAAGGADLLADAAARVARTGTPETVEVAPVRYPGRRLACHIDPFPDGCLLRADDLTEADEARAARAGLDATIAALDATGAIVVRINPRGHLDGPTPTLARLTGISRETLATARFVTLVAVDHRVVVGETIERVFADGAPREVTAPLLAHGADAVPARIGLAPLHDAGRIVALTAAIVPLPRAA